jgi:peptide/nickel transport system substrate-binding protein
MTAADVEFSYNLMFDEDSLNPSASFFQNSVAELEVVDDYTVVFHMNAPNWAILDNLDQISSSLVIISKNHWETLGQDDAINDPVGTGPFNFIEHRAGEYVKFEAVENHWRKTPDFKELYRRKVPEVATRVAMMRAGDLDVLDINIDFVTEVEDIEGVDIMISPGRLLFCYLYGQYLPEYADPTIPWAPHLDEPHNWLEPDTLSEWNARTLKVRQALDYAINKEDIIEFIQGGMALPCGSYFFWPDHGSFNPAWEPWPYDPDMAKQLIAEAGYDPGDIHITMNAGGRNALSAEAVGLYWETIGIDVSYDTMDTATYLGKSHERALSGFASLGDAGYFTTPAVWFERVHHVDSYYHLGYEDPVIDHLIESAMVELDTAKRDELQQMIGDLSYAGRLAIPIAYIGIPIALSPKVENWEVWDTRARPHTDNEYIEIAN